MGLAECMAGSRAHAVLCPGLARWTVGTQNPTWELGHSRCRSCHRHQGLCSSWRPDRRLCGRVVLGRLRGCAVAFDGHVAASVLIVANPGKGLGFR